MRRKKDDKRVLRPGNGGQNSSRRKRIKRSNRQVFSKNQNVARNRRKKRKSNNKLVFLMILALVAFVIGAGIGVSLSLDDGDDEGPRYENVTKEMLADANDTDTVYYDIESDDVDYNENSTSQFNFSYQSSYEE